MITTAPASIHTKTEPQYNPREVDQGGGWFVTRSGTRFYPLNPKIESILIEDIAFALSNTCRYGGHTQFYSVAEHSCIVADNLPPALKLLGLLHDATEAYLGDMVRPLKQQMPQYREAEHNLWKVIAEKFHLPVVMPPMIKEIDNRALLAERNHLMSENENTRNWYWDDFLKPLPCIVRCHAPEIARREFMKRYNELTK